MENPYSFIYFYDLLRVKMVIFGFQVSLTEGIPPVNFNHGNLGRLLSALSFLKSNPSVESRPFRRNSQNMQNEVNVLSMFVFRERHKNRSDY